MAKTAAILELPGKGAFAPEKIGSRYGDFMKTRIPGEVNPTWVFESRFYDTQNQEDVKAFNTMCAQVVPFCHQRKMRVVPRIIHLPAPTAKEKPAKKEGGTTKPSKKKAAQNQTSGQKKEPQAPALISPPGGE